MFSYCKIRQGKERTNHRIPRFALFALFYYSKGNLKKGLLGDIISINHEECVGNVHQSHSFVRENWGNSTRSSCMLLQKSCHDMDILQWLLDKKCKKIQSFGSLVHFTEKNTPKNGPKYFFEGGSTMSVMHQDVISQFLPKETIRSCERYGFGHINETYLICTESGKRYILQKINHKIFQDVEGLMSNIEAVTDYLSKQSADERSVLRPVRTEKQKSYFKNSDGSYWRVYHFVEDSVCLQKPNTPRDFFESAVAFGTFQQMLKDFPVSMLHETLPDFHNTAKRYRDFRTVLEQDPMDRARFVKKEIEFALEREKEAGILVEMQKKGLLPTRVTHNDTKLNNVMLDAKTGNALCVIDLDTVMPGLSLYDFGDSIRFGASTGAEDEKDLTQIEMDLSLFATYTKGYLSACPDLTDRELLMLPMGAKLMTLECGVRFLTDYLDGDHYFACHREGHNLDRCRTQFKLVWDMEQKWEQMQRIVSDCKNR